MKHNSQSMCVCLFNPASGCHTSIKPVCMTSNQVVCDVNQPFWKLCRFGILSLPALFPAFYTWDNCSFMGAIGMHCAHECCNHSITICLPPTAPTKVSWAQCIYVCMCNLQLEISGCSGAVIHVTIFQCTRILC